MGFPFWLFAGIGGGGINPNLQINTINQMSVGNADQLLGYTSLSSGAVTFSSSDPSKATIVVSGGNSYLHIIAPGSPVITASQAANGGYASASSPTTASITNTFTYTFDFQLA